jgi:hypothetical protein
LPEQEVGQALLAAGADDQVGVGLACGVEMAGDVAGGDRLGELSERGAASGLLVACYLTSFA